MVLLSSSRDVEAAIVPSPPGWLPFLTNRLRGLLFGRSSSKEALGLLLAGSLPLALRTE